MNQPIIHGRDPRAGGQEWLERYRNSLMNTFGDPQRVLVRGDGVHVWDADGNRYLDLLGGIAVNALGHGHPAVIEAVTAQLSTLGHISNFFTSAPQIEAAEKLRELLADDSARVFFTNSGTEANEAAFKLTRRTGRTTIVAAEGSFHGRSMGALALTSKAAYREPFEPLPGDVRWVPFGDAAALESAVDDSVAAVILEPIQGEGGVIVPPDDYLAAARRITDAHGALLWLDEVQSGVGRTGRWFAFEWSTPTIRPDIVTLAKGLGGGIPIGACVATGEAATLLQPGNHGTTFGGNPVATAAALAVMRTIESEHLLEHVRLRGEQLRMGLESNPFIDRVDGRGLMLGVQLVADRAADVHRAALESGIIVNPATPSRLRIVPPLILSEADTADAAATLSAVITEVLS